VDFCTSDFGGKLPVTRCVSPVVAMAKLAEYFHLPSLRHHLVVWPDRPRVVHHRRDEAGT
jgi:hypothetical protein